MKYNKRHERKIAMPLIVDKEHVRSEILDALQQCLEEKPLAKVSMRDIASRAKIAHSKINYYFDSKNQLLIAYIDFFAKHYKTEIKQWYITYKQNDSDMTEAPEKIIKHFIKAMVFANHKNQSWSFTQISTIVQYDSEMKTAIQNAYNSWKNAIKSILEEIYNDNGDHLLYKAEVILLIVDGMIVSSLCEQLDESKIDSILQNITL